MRTSSLVAAVALSCALTASCDRLSALGRSSTAAETPEPAPATPAEPAASGKAASAAAGGSVIGVAGVAAWDALSAAEKAKVKATPAVYLHQSVGQDLEDGAEAVGFKFEYYGPGATSVAAGPNGGLFNDVGPIDNGKPMEKLALVEKVAKRHQGALKVLAFSFGYADVRDEDLAKVEAEYVRVAKEVRKTGARMLHVTPPLVFDVAENGPKMKMRTWMLSTFAGEPIFDLQDIESQDGGKRCEVSGVWRICPANRSTVTCPSKGQGVDGDGQGHLCSTKAAVFAKALLYALSRARS
ncbi:MAG TPA: hypothetical protein VLT33_00990 [Labilithrix sp.]|nr:hypothetical protein [Labilithrix sp.]